MCNPNLKTKTKMGCFTIIMGCSNPVQPELENNLENQVNISHSLFNVNLDTVQSREELE